MKAVYNLNILFMSLNGKTIFIVDDDKFLLDMYSLKFKNAGMKVDVAASTNEALDKLEGGLNPDIIVLDIIMPSVDGLSFLEELKEKGLVGESVVVMLTNQGLQEDIEKARSLGVQGYIVKATTIPSEVVKEIEEIVNSKNN